MESNAELTALRAEVERLEHLLSVVACRATGGMLAQTGYDETVYLDQIDAYRARECETCEINMVSEMERLRRHNTECTHLWEESGHGFKACIHCGEQRS